MMLSSYYYDSSVKLLVQNTAQKYSLVPADRHTGGYVDASIILGNSKQHSFLLSEFPGNCSTLILSNLQDVIDTTTYEPDARDAIKCAIELCNVFEYGGLMITGTSQKMMDILVNDFKFNVCIPDLFNPHSDNENYFLIKKLEV